MKICMYKISCIRDMGVEHLRMPRQSDGDKDEKGQIFQTPGELIQDVVFYLRSYLSGPGSPRERHLIFYHVITGTSPPLCFPYRVLRDRLQSTIMRLLPSQLVWMSGSLFGPTQTQQQAQPHLVQENTGISQNYIGVNTVDKHAVIRRVERILSNFFENPGPGKILHILASRDNPPLLLAFVGRRDQLILGQQYLIAEMLKSSRDQ